MNDIIDFPVRCGQCNIEIDQGEIYYLHPKYGPVCENCPAFKDGGIEVKDE